MRADLNKILVLRPREPSFGEKKNQATARIRRFDTWNRTNLIYWEDRGSFTKQPMRPTGILNRGRYNYRKMLSENFSPLIRLLRSNVGRPWNDLFSELREVCKPDSAINAHVYQHLYDFVHVNPADEDDILGFYRFFVDSTGVLREATKRRAKIIKETQDETIVWDGKNIVFLRIKNSWQLVQVRALLPYTTTADFVSGLDFYFPSHHLLRISLRTDGASVVPAKSWHSKGWLDSWYKWCSKNKMYSVSCKSANKKDKKQLKELLGGELVSIR